MERTGLQRCHVRQQLAGPPFTTTLGVMTNHVAVSEPDVLLATTLFLMERGATPYQFSVAAGRGIDTGAMLGRLRNAFKSAGFSGNGADILAVSETEWWAIECKGSGVGKPQTQRNNFDRALASVVSYFENKPQGLPPEYASVRTHLGLALPATEAYLRELRRRVRRPLRERLNLWVLLYDAGSKSIRPVAPHENI